MKCKQTVLGYKRLSLIQSWERLEKQHFSYSAKVSTPLTKTDYFFFAQRISINLVHL